MKYKVKKNNEKGEIINKSLEKNGEFIPSFYNWMDLDKQKKIAEKLANMTKKEK